MSPERLTPADAVLLQIEDDVSAVHGMTIGVFAGPQPSFDDLQDHVSKRIRMVPRYRQRLVEVPFGIERPCWVDDPHFSIDFHVRNTALPQRRDADALSALVTRLQSQRMDRSKPLWELWLVSNLRDGHWALISKVHYAMIDGVSGTDLFGLLLDEASDMPLGDETAPPPLPSDAELITGAVIDRLFNPIETTQSVMAMASAPWRLGMQTFDRLRARADNGGFDITVGPHRRWHRCQAPLDLFRKARELHDCSTNDVILACITGGIRHYLLERGQTIPAHLRALIPLAIASEDTGFQQEIAATTLRLPVGLDDPLARLDTITAHTALRARDKGAITADAFRRQHQFSTPTVLAQGVRAALGRAHTSSRVDTVAVNVPGPAETQHLFGCELLKVYPVIPLASGVPIAVAAISYRDDVSFGITGDYDATPDIAIIATGIVASLHDLAG